MLAYRIVKSESIKTHGRDRVRLVLSPDGIEDPKINAVVFDPADLPDRELADHFSYAFPPSEGKRPEVMVNGVMMFMEILKKEPVYAVQKGTPENFAGMTAWSTSPGRARKQDVMKAAMAFATQVVTGHEIIMVAAWE